MKRLRTPILVPVFLVFSGCYTQTIYFEPYPPGGAALLQTTRAERKKGGSSVVDAAYRAQGRMTSRRATPAADESIVDIAKQYLGIPYKYGGRSPKTGFDCSGFTGYVYHEAGFSLPRGADDQFDALTPVRKPQPGDLVFFRINGTKVSHVGIYAGNYRFIHAPRTGKNVGYADMRISYWKKRYAGARTIQGN